MPALQLQIKISLYSHREPDLYTYFKTLPPGVRAEFLRMALDRAMQAGLMPQLEHLQRVFGEVASSKARRKSAAEVRHAQPKSSIGGGEVSPASVRKSISEAVDAPRAETISVQASRVLPSATVAAAAPEADMAQRIAQMQRLNRFG